MKLRERNPLTVPGNWFIDTACIDCGAACDVAPGLIVERGGQSVFARQPESPEEQRMAWRARIACPTGSVRTVHPVAAPEHVFPERMADNVFRLGFNARTSYGAHSYLVRRDAGNFMVDSPRWASRVVNQIENWGGLSDILLSHRDDVADAHRYAAHFHARVWIHADDRAAAPYATDLIEGEMAHELAPDLLAIPLPGHTKGSVAYLYARRYLFTGDSLAWSFERNDLVAYKDFTWFSWEAQLQSLARLLVYPFEWVLAGHGGSYGLPAHEMRQRLATLLRHLSKT